MTTCNNMAPAGEIPASTDEGSEVTCAYQSGTANYEECFYCDEYYTAAITTAAISSTRG